MGHRWQWIAPLLVLSAVAIASQAADAARIVVLPLPWPSRAFDLVRLSAELTRRGHEVMLVTPAEYSPRISAMLARALPT